MRIAAGVLAAFLVTAAAQAASANNQSKREFGIFEVRLDGTMRRALLRNPAIRSVAEMSPDRARILFVEATGLPRRQSRLYSASLDGGKARLLATSSFIDAPTWSPDGRMIAFEGASDAGCLPESTGCPMGEIWVVNANGTALRSVARRGIAPSWSPDSGRLAFAGRYSTYYQRGVVTVAGLDDTGPPRELSPVEPEARSEWKLTWSPQGNRLAYTIQKGRSSLVRVARLNSKPRRGARTLLGGTGPRWSPNGKRIAFWTRWSRSLSVSDANGRHRRRLTRGMDPLWSPDGRWIAFVDDVVHDCFQVYVIRPSGEHRVAMTNEPCGAHFDVFWATDSERLIYAATSSG